MKSHLPLPCYLIRIPLDELHFDQLPQAMNTLDRGTWRETKIRIIIFSQITESTLSKCKLAKCGKNCKLNTPYEVNLTAANGRNEHKENNFSGVGWIKSTLKLFLAENYIRKQDREQIGVFYMRMGIFISSDNKTN